MEEELSYERKRNKRLQYRIDYLEDSNDHLRNVIRYKNDKIQNQRDRNREMQIKMKRQKRKNNPNKKKKEKQPEPKVNFNNSWNSWNSFD